MAEGYLAEAWRLLGEGLGPYVFEKTGDPKLRDTRDVYAILRKMVARGHWDQYFTALDRNERNWISELFELRNESWAHQGVYSDEDIHHYLGVMVRLLRSISASEQTDSVAQLHTAIGRLIYSQIPVLDTESPSQIILTLPEGMGGDDFVEILRRAMSGISPQGSLTPTDYVDAPAGSDVVDLDNPNNVDTYILWGERSLEDDNYDEAITNFSEAIELSLEDPRGYRARGNVYVQKKEYGLRRVYIQI